MSSSDKQTSLIVFVLVFLLILAEECHFWCLELQSLSSVYNALYKVIDEEKDYSG